MESAAQSEMKEIEEMLSLFGSAELTVDSPSKRCVLASHPDSPGYTARFGQARRLQESYRITRNSASITQKW